MLRKFGIYANPKDNTICILTHIIQNRIIGMDFDEYIFEELSNNSINFSLDRSCSVYDNGGVFEIDLNQFPHSFKDCGYLGQIKNLDLQLKMKEYVEDLWNC